jgi:hypothetical protein
MPLDEQKAGVILIVWYLKPMLISTFAEVRAEFSKRHVHRQTPQQTSGVSHSSLLGVP